jgi:hypothetical protein
LFAGGAAVAPEADAGGEHVDGVIVGDGDEPEHGARHVVVVVAPVYVPQAGVSGEVGWHRGGCLAWHGMCSDAF